MTDLDPQFLEFISAPLRLPKDLEAWGRLTEIGRDSVLDLIQKAAGSAILPPEVLFL